MMVSCPTPAPASAGITALPIPPAPITATVEPASVPLSCGSHDQARAYWLKLRIPAISRPSASSATCAAYAPAAVVNVTPGVARTRLHRARLRLRASLSPDSSDTQEPRHDH